jgi:hypothetical protein
MKERIRAASLVGAAIAGTLGSIGLCTAPAWYGLTRAKPRAVDTAAVAAPPDAAMEMQASLPPAQAGCDCEPAMCAAGTEVECTRHADCVEEECCCCGRCVDPERREVGALAIDELPQTDAMTTDLCIGALDRGAVASGYRWGDGAVLARTEVADLVSFLIEMNWIATFILIVESDDSYNAYAKHLVRRGQSQQAIVYSPSLLRDVIAHDSVDFFAVAFVLAHEVGHHVRGHFPRRTPARTAEAEADRYAARQLLALCATREEVAAAVDALTSQSSEPGLHGTPQVRRARALRAFDADADSAPSLAQCATRARVVVAKLDEPARAVILPYVRLLETRVIVELAQQATEAREID